MGRHGCLSLMCVLAVMYVLAAAFQECLLSGLCFQHVLTPTCIYIALILLPIPITWDVKGLLQGRGW